MRQAISPTHTPASRLCTPTLRPGQEVSLDVPEPGILQQVAAKPVGKQDGFFFFFFFFFGFFFFFFFFRFCILILTSHLCSKVY